MPFYELVLCFYAELIFINKCRNNLSMKVWNRSLIDVNLVDEVGVNNIQTTLYNAF